MAQTGWLSLEISVFMRLPLSRLTHSILVAVPLDVMLISKGATWLHMTPVFKRPVHLSTGRIRNFASCLRQFSYTIEARAPMMSSSLSTCFFPGKTGAGLQGDGSLGGFLCAGWSCAVPPILMIRYRVGPFFNVPPNLLRHNMKRCV